MEEKKVVGEKRRVWFTGSQSSSLLSESVPMVSEELSESRSCPVPWLMCSAVVESAEVERSSSFTSVPGL